MKFEPTLASALSLVRIRSPPKISLWSRIKEWGDNTGTFWMVYAGITSCHSSFLQVKEDVSNTKICQIGGKNMAYFFVAGFITGVVLCVVCEFNQDLRRYATGTQFA